MTEDRVIVVQEKTSGMVIKVCASWDDYDVWLDQKTHGWGDEDLNTTDARVNEYTQ